MDGEREGRGNELAELLLKAEGADGTWVVSERVVSALHSVSDVVVLPDANSSSSASFHGFHLDHESESECEMGLKKQTSVGEQMVRGM